MKRRKLLTLAATAGICSAGLGTVVMPANAELRTLTVTLLGGKQVVVTVDVPPGTPVDQIKIPGISTPIVSVVDSGPAATPEPSATPSPTAAPDKPSATSTPDSGRPSSAGSGSSKEQQTSRPSGSAGSKSGKGSTKRRKGSANAQSDAVGVVDQALVEEGTGAGPRKRVDADNRGRNTDGTPTLDNPSFTLAQPGAAPIGVPNFFIEKFRIPRRSAISTAKRMASSCCA